MPLLHHVIDISSFKLERLFRVRVQRRQNNSKHNVSIESATPSATLLITFAGQEKDFFSFTFLPPNKHGRPQR